MESGGLAKNSQTRTCSSLLDMALWRRPRDSVAMLALGRTTHPSSSLRVQVSLSVRVSSSWSSSLPSLASPVRTVYIAQLLTEHYSLRAIVSPTTVLASSTFQALCKQQPGPNRANHQTWASHRLRATVCQGNGVVSSPTSLCLSRHHLSTCEYLFPQVHEGSVVVAASRAGLA